MKRLRKLILLPVRNLAYRWDKKRTYYWAALHLYDLRTVTLLPDCYYRFLFNISMRLVEFRQTRRLADRMIHSIPYHIRFGMA